MASARARPRWVNAVSATASTAANRTSTAEPARATISMVLMPAVLRDSGGRRPGSSTEPFQVGDLAFAHPRGLVGVGVVVAQDVEHTVDDEQRHSSS